ncbi:MAG: exodeoxyribonuclease VII small subunit [Gammaproteobacteria bacterium]
MTFETALQDLDKIVHALEKGDLSLEVALSEFEKGVSLVRNCQETLSKAEQRIQQLVQKDGKMSASDVNTVEGEKSE